MFQPVPQQRIFRELLGPRPRWVPIYCGVCAKKNPGRPPPMIGEGTGRTVATEFREVTLHLSDSELDPEFVGEKDFGISPEELIGTATTWKKPYGQLHQFVRDSPRVSAEELRGDIVERMPYLTDVQVEEELLDCLGQRRSSRSRTRLAFADVEIRESRSVLSCLQCGVTSTMSRADLARKIEMALAADTLVYVSPAGLTLVSGGANAATGEVREHLPGSQP